MALQNIGILPQHNPEDMGLYWYDDFTAASPSHTTDGHSVSQSVSQSVLELSPSGTHNQILAVVKIFAALLP